MKSDNGMSPLIPGPDPQVQAAPDHRILPVANLCLEGNEARYLDECLRSGWISSAGPFVGRFENAFASAVGCEHGVATANGTAALHLALTALGIGSGDEVIVPAFTMIAVANAVRFTGARPVLVDGESDTCNLDPGMIEGCLTPRTKAVIAVHTYGHPAEMAAIMSLARKHRLLVVEDAAEAHGAHYRGEPVGSIGDAAIFSFYANKIITTGEGGMVTTHSPIVAEKARLLRDHAFSPERHFWHREVGFNYRMTSMQAAVGLAQTERFAKLVQRRRDNAHIYRELLRPVRGLTLPVEREHVCNVFWMYGVLVEDSFGMTRDQLRAHLARHGIETRTYFIPLHLQPIYRDSYKGQRFPVAERWCQRGMYLPSGPSLGAEDLKRVAEVIRSARKRKVRAA